MLSATQRGKYKNLRLPLIILGFTLLSGCAVNMMSAHDEKTYTRIEAFDPALNDLLYRLEEQDGKQPECAYENYVDDYRDLKVQLRTMAMYEQAKPKNSQTQQQIAALQERLKLFTTDHKRVCPPAVAVMIAQKQMNQMLGHILKLESEKRQQD